LKWFSKNKVSLFGDIDFKSSMDDKRRDNKIKAMSHFDWFWFNPGAFKLIFIGRYIFTVIFITILLMFLESYISIILKVFVVGYIAFLFVRGVMAYKKYRGTSINFWDLYIREYD